MSASHDDLSALHATVENGTFREQPDSDAEARARAWLDDAERILTTSLARPAEARPQEPFSRSMVAAVVAARVRRRALSSSDDASALAATARGGSLLERKVALERLIALADAGSADPEAVDLGSADWEPELERDSLLLSCKRRGGVARDARATLAAADEVCRRFEAALGAVLDGTQSGDPYQLLDPEERSQLMLHLRATSDLACAFVCDRVVELCKGGDSLEALDRIAALRPAADPRTLPLLSILLLDDPRPDIRAEAARSMGRIDDSRVVPLLASTFARASDLGERIALAEALGMWGDFRGSDAIREGLRDARDSLRVAALEALSDPALAESAVVFARARDIELRRAALRAIGRAGDERALGWLEELGAEGDRTLASEIGRARGAVLARAEMRGDAPAELLARAARQAGKKQHALSAPLSRKLGAPPTKRHRFAAWMLIVRASLLSLFRRREAASELYERALAADPSWHFPPLLEASMWDRAGDGVRAVAAYRRALAAAPDKVAANVRRMTRIASAYLARVEELLAADRLEAARALVDELSIHDLSRVPSHVRLAVRRRRKRLTLTSLPDTGERGAA